jgi:murein DD-endopeptidase MepM/ murein hydrolase activator NlpD
MSPVLARAFWLFPSAKASGEGSEPPIMHDSSLPLLSAAINSDPNPEKGGGDLIVTEGSALVANAGPEGTLADIDPSSGSGEISTYVVKAGDTISSVANAFGVSTNTIMWANGLTKKSTLTPGSTLVILPVSGVKHTVGKGETLASIAQKYNADMADIASFNGLETGDTLNQGDVLVIPGGEVVQTPEKKKETKTTAKTKKTTSKIHQGGGLTSIESAGGSADTDGYFSNPVPGALLTQGIHGWNGVDLGAPSGTPIYAAAAGTVIVSRASGWNGGYGNYVVIRHSNGTQTLYSHLSSDNVSVGDTVSKGQRIGGVGRTGEATGNHLHFEVRGGRNPFAGCSEMTHCSL